MARRPCPRIGNITPAFSAVRRLATGTRRAALRLALLGASCALGAAIPARADEPGPASFRYETEATGRRVIFIRNTAAQEARAAATAAGLELRTLPQIAAEEAPDSAPATPPQLAGNVDWVPDEAQQASVAMRTDQPGGPQFWDELYRRSLQEHAAAVQLADAFLAVHGQAFGRVPPARPYAGLPSAWPATVSEGLAVAPHTALVATRAEKDHLGMTHVRYAQRYRGLPVIGAEVIVHLNALGQVATASGRVVTGLDRPDVTPGISQEHAEAFAQAEWRARHATQVNPAVKRAALCVIQPGLLNNTDDPAVYLAWEIELIDEPAWANESYFVDASSGAVVQSLDHVRHLKRRVPDCSAQPNTGNCWSNMLIQQNDPQWGWPANPPSEYLFGCRDEGGLWPCPHGPNPRYLPDEISTATDDLFVLLGEVHQYYWVKFGRNGANGLGGNVDGSYSGFTVDTDGGWSNIDFLSGWTCPTAAYYPDQGIYHCKDAVVPDVVGHEYAHGVDYGLTYHGQSGALDESHSDTMGEMFEYWLTGANDWISGGSIDDLTSKRNLADPPLFEDSYLWGLRYPDRFYSTNMYCGPFDNGGVHHNSTVPSKALYLASVGGRFNGCTVLPIGREAVEQILHRAKTVYYAASVTFNGAYLDQIQAATDLYGAGSFEVQQLTRALQAVELDQAGYCADPQLLQWHPPALRDIRADLRPDFYVDLADYALLAGCLSGVGLPPSNTPLCGEADLDEDGDVDLADFAILQRCHRGPDVPADPACNP